MHTRQSGLVLITVLWLISLLTLLATATLAIARSHTRLATRAAQTITAETIADSALRLTLLQVREPLSPGRELGFAAHWRLEVLAREIEIRVEREAGRVDLNAADAPLLAAVFTAGGTDPGIAHSFASRILDWRDTDEQPERDGAEDLDYERAHVAYRPRNGPFESIGELRQVLGLTELSPTVVDAFTVYSTRSPLITPEFAHPLAHKALELLARSPSFPYTPFAAFGAQGLLGQVVRAHACVNIEAVTTCRAVIARLMDDRYKPFLIYAWYTEPPASTTRPTAE